MIDVGQLHETLKLHHDLQDKGLTPDEFTVSGVLNSYCQNGDMEGALGFFLEFKTKGTLPDFTVFMYLVRGLCDKRNGRISIHLEGDVSIKTCH